MSLFKILLACFGLLSLAAADCCDWNGCTPDVNKVYGHGECPPRHDMKDGFCEGSPTFMDKKVCVVFCQVKTEYGYDAEMPIGGTWVGGWGMYGSSQWYRVGIHWKEPIELPKDTPQFVLEDGVSGGFSRSSRGLTKIDHVDIEVQDGEYGYFTFLPMKKYVCGTTTKDNSWFWQPSCAKNRKNLGNQCAVQMVTNAGDNGFWWFAGDVGEPTVSGHTVFVYTDSNGYRLDRSKQSARYQFAMDKGMALTDASYAGWSKVWRNPVLADKFQGGKHGPQDNLLSCYAQLPTVDKAVRDADVIHCVYAVGKLMREPSKLLPIKKKGQNYGFEWERGCQIGVTYDTDWPKDCDVAQAEVVAAAGFINFNCMREDYVKEHTRFAVKGSHVVRSADNKCAATVWVWGGSGPGGTNIGDTGDKLVPDDFPNAAFLNNLPKDQPPAYIGDPYEPGWAEQEWNASHPNWP